MYGFESWFAFFSIIHLDYFDTIWNDKDFKYQKLSTIAFVAVCDFSAKGNAHVWKDINECGESCTLLKEAFEDTYPTTFAGYSKADHTHFVALTNSFDITVRGKYSERTSANVFFSFRGTWVWDVVNMRRNNENSLMLSSLCEGCGVMKGAYKNFMALRSTLTLTYLKAEKIVVDAGQSPSVIVVGMSMGGMMANYGGMYMRFRLSKMVRAIYTFGAPRHANAKFHEFMEQIENTQFALYRDPVPHLPPKLLGFRSSAQELYLLYFDPIMHVLESQGVKDHYYKYLHFKKFQGRSMDSKYADSTNFYDVHDHTEYFVGLNQMSLFTCGGFADYYLENVEGTALFI